MYYLMTYKDFKDGQIILATNRKKKMRRLYRIVNTHRINGTVHCVYICLIGDRSKDEEYIHFTHNQVTTEIRNPEEYFKEMHLKIIK